MNEQQMISLREYFETLLAEREKRLDERWASQERAIEKAVTQLEARLHLLNELRDNVLTRTEYDAKHEVLLTRISQMEQWRANVMGRTIAIGVIGAILIAVLSAVISHALG